MTGVAHVQNIWFLREKWLSWKSSWQINEKVWMLLKRVFDLNCRKKKINNNAQFGKRFSLIRGHKYVLINIPQAAKSIQAAPLSVRVQKCTLTLAYKIWMVSKGIFFYWLAAGPFHWGWTNVNECKLRSPKRLVLALCGMG